MFWLFLNTWNTVVITDMLSYLLVQHLCHSCVSFHWLIILLVMGYVFLILYTYPNLCSDARHCEFYLVECWVFLDFYKCSWSLFWNKIVSWKHFNPFELYFYDLSQCRTMPCLGFIIPNYWGKIILNFLPSASWIKSFSSLPGENKHYSWSVIFFRHELISIFCWILKWRLSTDLWSSLSLCSFLCLTHHSYLQILAALVSTNS